MLETAKLDSRYFLKNYQIRTFHRDPADVGFDERRKSDFESAQQEFFSPMAHVGSYAERNEISVVFNIANHLEHFIGRKSGNENNEIFRGEYSSNRENLRTD